MLYKKYEEILGLRWPVEYAHSFSAPTFGIDTDPFLKKYKVILCNLISVDNKKFESSVVHELIHAFLAERIDPAFAGYYYHIVNSVNMSAEQKTTRINKLYLSWAHVDIWVDELLNKFFPNPMVEENELYVNTLRKMANHRPEELRLPIFYVPIAIHMAVASRSKTERGNLSPVFRALGGELTDLVNKLSDFYTSLHSLSFNRKNDLLLLEESVQTSALIQKFDFVPQLLEEQNSNIPIMRWHI